MIIAILGARGIPNHYGGFEQFAQYLSEGLVQRGHQVSVYSPHNHPYQQNNWEGVRIIHQYDPENTLGTAGQFIYDFNCILDSRKREFDIILQLGYTSSSIWHWLLPQNSVIITNTDGLEWKRTKYSRPVQGFLKYAEKLGVHSSDYLVADSIGIQRYLKTSYGKSSTYIPYGATVFQRADASVLSEYGVEVDSFNMMIARLEPENNIETILEGSCRASFTLPLLVVGNHHSRYGKYLKNKFKQHHIQFLGPVYDMRLLNNLRHFCHVYFHGHTVGGTNPSLLEAMAAGAFICAHDNEFNNFILGEDAHYFSDSFSVARVLEEALPIAERKLRIAANIKKIKNQFAWEGIIGQYEQLMQQCMAEKKIPEQV